MSMASPFFIRTSPTSAVEWGSLLHLAVFAVIVFHCLKTRREATSTLLWIFVAWSLPVVGPLLYLSFGISRVATKAWRKRQADEAFSRERAARTAASMPLEYWRTIRDSVAAEDPSSVGRAVNRTLNIALPDAPLLGGNRIEPLVGGDEAFPRMLEAIRGASHHVHLQTFMIVNDAVGREFLDALRERAEKGVTVRFLYDRFGSTRASVRGLFRRYRGIPNLRLSGWTQANPLKRQFQINLRNHRKALIVDGRVAFTGGINLHAEHTTRPGQPAIRDYHFALAGPIVHELQYAFLHDWYFMTDESADDLLRPEHFPRIEPSGHVLARVLTGGPSMETETIADALFASLNAAERQILLVTPYFVPPPDIVRALRVAALRGVDVRLVVPRENNHFYAGMAGRGLYATLLEAGVRIFEREPPFMHAKALIVDGVLSLVGTANADMRSLRLNYETDLVISDEAFADALKAIVLEDVAASRELDLQTWRARPLRRRLAENLCGLLTPIL